MKKNASCFSCPTYDHLCILIIITIPKGLNELSKTLKTLCVCNRYKLPTYFLIRVARNSLIFFDRPVVHLGVVALSFSFSAFCLGVVRLCPTLLLRLRVVFLVGLRVRTLVRLVVVAIACCSIVTSPPQEPPGST